MRRSAPFSSVAEPKRGLDPRSQGLAFAPALAHIPGVPRGAGGEPAEIVLNPGRPPLEPDPGHAGEGTDFSATASPSLQPRPQIRGAPVDSRASEAQGNADVDRSCPHS